MKTLFALLACTLAYRLAGECAGYIGILAATFRLMERGRDPERITQVLHDDNGTGPVSEVLKPLFAGFGMWFWPLRVRTMYQQLFEVLEEQTRPWREHR